jgi:hyaluronate lyase
VSTKRLADGEGGAWGAPRPDAPWAGGATDGTHAALGQHVRGLSSTLQGMKSWFCLGDSVVCLGAGISAADGVPVETVVDNRNLGADGRNALYADGHRLPAGTGTARRFRNPRSLAIEGSGAYLFPEGGTVNVLREDRTGSWHDINTGSSTAPLTRTYLTLWFDHGTDPTDASYAYVLLPGAGPAAAARHRPARVLANTPAVQAVLDAPGRVLAANFHSAGRLGPLTVDTPCSVVVSATPHRLTIAVADPSQTATSVTLTLDTAARHPIDTPPSTRVASLHPVTLRADLSAARGASRVTVLETRTPGLRECW